jgi:hypothetical protein
MLSVGVFDLFFGLRFEQRFAEAGKILCHSDRACF